MKCKNKYEREHGLICVCGSLFMGLLQAGITWCDPDKFPIIYIFPGGVITLVVVFGFFQGVLEILESYTGWELL